MTEKNWTITALLDTTQKFLAQKKCDSPRLDAEILLAHVLKMKRIELYLNFDRPLATPELDTYRTLVKRRADHEPIAYMMGEKEFYSRPFKVTPDVLIPRPETELLVEEVIKINGKNILEIGTGSGCIAIAQAKNIPGSKIIATDISPKALAMAKANIESHNLQNQITTLLSDIAPWETFRSENTTFDVIVSNPPYIPEGEITTLQPEVCHEPHTALSGGPTGLEIIEKIHEQSISFLKAEGILIMEIGEGQAEVLKERFAQHPSLPFLSSVKDYQGVERINLFQKK